MYHGYSNYKLLKKFFIFLLKTCLTLSKLISHNYKDGYNK